jgi:hypothetical protein
MKKQNKDMEEVKLGIRKVLRDRYCPKPLITIEKLFAFALGIVVFSGVFLLLKFANPINFGILMATLILLAILFNWIR